MRLREYFDDQDRKIKQLEAENAALRQRVQELEVELAHIGETSEKMLAYLNAKLAEYNGEGVA